MNTPGFPDLNLDGRRLPMATFLREEAAYALEAFRQRPDDVAEVWFGENAVPQALLVLPDGETQHVAWDGNDWVVERSW